MSEKKRISLTTSRADWTTEPNSSFGKWTLHDRLMGVLVGIGSGFPVIGLFLGIGAAFFYGKLKAGKHPGMATHLLYWFTGFPEPKELPGSHIRELNG